MLYLRRKTDAFLAARKANPDRKLRIVKGPRQVGKTESIRRFGERNYKSVIGSGSTLGINYRKSKQQLWLQIGS